MRLSPRPALLLLPVIAVAYLLPRVWALQGVERVSFFSFLDMPGHLSNLDTVARARALPRALQREPFMKRFGLPRAAIRNPVRWPQGIYQIAASWAAGLGVLSPWTTQLTNGLFTLMLLAGVLGLGALMGGTRCSPASRSRLTVVARASPCA